MSVNIVKKPVWVIKIEREMPRMGVVERRVADYLLKKSKDMISMTITEFSEACGASEATIVRFCRHIGYAGFQDLKLAIAQDVVSPLSVMYDGIGPEDSIGTIKNKVFTSNIQAMNDTLELVDDKELERAVDAIYSAHYFDIYGMGGSGIIARDAQHKFLKIGIRASVFSDTHLQALAMTQLGKGDTVMGISYSGASTDVIETLKYAKQNGARTICLTHLAKSPITRVSDIKLYTTASETMFRSDGIVSRMAQLAIIDTLYIGVALKMGDKAIENLEKGRLASVSKGY